MTAPASHLAIAAALAVAVSSYAVASSGKLFKSRALDTKDKFSFTFTAPGTYEYFCSLHPHMTGAIVVEAAIGSSNAAQ